MQGVAEACVQRGVSLVVVGPEDPLAQGLANTLTAAGIKVRAWVVEIYVLNFL